MGKDKSLKGQVMFSQCDDIIESQTEFIDLKPVEPIVHNVLSPEYLWDVDDNWEYYCSGDLAEGEVFTFEKKFVADNQGHLFAIRGNASRRQRFTIKLNIPEIGFNYEKTCERSGKFCLLGPWYNLTSPLYPIEGSNGLGIKSTATFSIEALTKVSKASFFFDIRYSCHQILDGICGGHDSSEIISWSPTWRLVT